MLALIFPALLVTVDAYTEYLAAYHDMATHNVMDVTGGLDASIRFADEQARPENAGDGFVNTVGVLVNMANRYISIADALAIGALLAIENW
ncbi:hypothetical protein C8R44DRAFT_865318 [Mycena epipterygia]|nr:hypothetical protein C8R44DRAFT_865318 [Mycena epipterygia]